MSIEADFVHLARLALSGRREDVIALVRRAVRTLAAHDPELADQAKEALRIAGKSTPIRGTPVQPLPVDSDTRLELLRREEAVTLHEQPVWTHQVMRELSAVVKERAQESLLLSEGIQPSRSMLFIGPSGVGKTLAARWLAAEIKRPLLTLDLAAVMSSFLGRTGNNIRVVLNFAQKSPSILLLDEFDAIAKRRDDSAEVGELKRLVTVLLQAVDDWPPEGILIAATNHPELLDPAVWRRFDRIVEFPLPSETHIAQMIENLLDGHEDGIRAEISILASALNGRSFAEVAREVNLARRTTVLERSDLRSVFAEMAGRLCTSGDLSQRLRIADSLLQSGHSTREVSLLTNLARDTIRKHLGSRSLKRGRPRRREA